MLKLFTVIGANGFIGSALAASLEAEGAYVQRWTREMPLGEEVPLGHAIFAAGVTADFRTRAPETAEAHISLTAKLLYRYRYDSFTYLSSARIYRLAETTHEDASFNVNPSESEHFYDLTKLAGEALCLGIANPAVRVVRLSNVAGVDTASENFLPSLIRDALTQKKLHLRCTPDSCKDYVMLSDVVAMLPRIAREGRERLYNLASGQVTEANFIATCLQEATGCELSYEPGAPALRQPAIAIGKLQAEFGFTPAPLAPHLKELIHATELALHR